jgi:hypothetical protein
VVRLAHGCVRLEGATFGPVYLSPMQVGRLRGALRTAVVDLGLLGGDEIPAPRVPEPPAAGPAATSRRRTVLMHLMPKHTVAVIMAHLNAGAVADDGRRA